METPTQPVEVAHPAPTAPQQPVVLSRLMLQWEFVVVCAIMWVPSLYTGLADYLGWRKPSAVPMDEVYSVYSALAYSALPIFLLWRNGEPFRKFGFKSFDRRDAVVAFALLVFAAILSTIYAPLVKSISFQHGAVTSLRVSHALFRPFELLIYLAGAFREEIFYRAYLCSRLRDFGLNTTRTVIISALLFASIHIYQGWAPLPQHFIFGVVFAYIFLNYRSLWQVVLAHAFYNFFLLISH